MKAIIKITHAYFEHDSCYHKEIEEIGIICETLEKKGNSIMADNVIIEIPQYHDDLKVDVVSKFWWEKS